MDSFKNKEKEEVFSRSVKARKRTYFFDVKETKTTGERYLTITESKKCFNNEDGSFYYEKHKIFLYNEDIEKFLKELKTTIKFIETGEVPEEEIMEDLLEQPVDFDSELDKLKF